MSQPTSLKNPAEARKRGIRRFALAAVVLIPLAFAGLIVSALPSEDDALKTIPAALVNDDTLVNQVADDGTKTPVFAGRQLVTELTGDKATGFDWTITNAADAKKMLKDGTVYAVLTVPSDFSKSILSISGDNPVKAKFSIRVDDSHSYLTSVVAETVGSGMTAAFGTEVTQQYITGLYSGLGTLGTSLGKAADGAEKLGSGAGDLTDGLETLADGVDSAANGADQYASGVSKYTKGVDSISGGVSTLADQTKSLGKLSSGVKDYTDGVAAYAGGVDTIAEQLAQLTAGAAMDPTMNPQTLAYLQQLSGGLTKAAAGGDQLAAGGKTLAAGTSGLPKLSAGISDLADGTAKLSDGSPALRGGARDLASGLGQLGSGASSAADGAGKIADGANTLADGLRKGADQVPTMSDDQAKDAADVASDPVSYSVRTNNRVGDIGQMVSTLLIPLGLWIGALAVFLVLRPVTRRSLVSTAGNGRLVFSTLSRASIVTGAQALLLVALLHLGLKVEWSLLPATLLFSLLMAFAFTAFHYLLTIAFGRAGLVISLFFLALQVTATGGLYPIELLAAPFRAISPLLPLTHGVNGMQAILSGGAASTVIGAAVALVLFGVVSVLLGLAALRSKRRAGALGLVPQQA